MPRMLAFILALLLALPSLAHAQVMVQESTVRVHVTGRVQQPGVYALPRGARAVDAIQAAGGIAKGAVLSELNLASVLSDGERLDVPSMTPSRPPAPGGSAASRRPAQQTRGRVPRGRISLNQATLEQLDALPGIGRTLAEEVLRYRQQKGRFRSLDELKEVPGIGERRFERLAPLLTL